MSVTSLSAALGADPDTDRGPESAWRDARYERKLRVPERVGADMETRLRMHRGAFLSLYPPRQVNSLYFDTPDLRCLHDNVAGNRDRFKVRIRWYGEADGPVEDAVLEIKRKRGFAGIKSRYRLGALDLSAELEPDRLLRRYEDAGVPLELRLGLAALTPVLQNDYSRRYLLSAGGHFRATIDDRMHFRQVLRADLSFEGRRFLLPGSVLELKYRLEDEARLADLVGDMPYRVSRNSKYVTGMRGCWG